MSSVLGSKMVVPVIVLVQQTGCKVAAIGLDSALFPSQKYVAELWKDNLLDCRILHHASLLLPHLLVRASIHVFTFNIF